MNKQPTITADDIMNTIKRILKEAETQADYKGEKFIGVEGKQLLIQLSQRLNIDYDTIIKLLK